MAWDGVMALWGMAVWWRAALRSGAVSVVGLSRCQLVILDPGQSYSTSTASTRARPTSTTLRLWPSSQRHNSISAAANGATLCSVVVDLAGSRWRSHFDSVSGHVQFADSDVPKATHSCAPFG